MRKGQSGNIYIYIYIKADVKYCKSHRLWNWSRKRNEEEVKVHVGQSSWTRCGLETVKTTPSMFSCLIFTHSGFVVGPKRKIQFAPSGAKRKWGQPFWTHNRKWPSQVNEFNFSWPRTVCHLQDLSFTDKNTFRIKLQTYCRRPTADLICSFFTSLKPKLKLSCKINPKKQRNLTRLWPEKWKVSHLTV